jgi:hypothetical protein
MRFITTISILLAALVPLATPVLAAPGRPAPTSTDPAAVSAAALADAAAAALSTRAVPDFPRALDRAAVLRALQERSRCGGSDTPETHAQVLTDRFGAQVPRAVMHLIVTEETLSLTDVMYHLQLLRAWVQAGALGGDEVAALVAALRDQAEAIVVGRTAQIAAELEPTDLAALRAWAADSLRRELVRALIGNNDARAIREVGLALRSESPGVRAEAARIALKQRAQPLRDEVAAMCARDIPSVREVVCPEL